MKKLMIAAALAAMGASVLAADAEKSAKPEPKKIKVSVLGDSYSTFWGVTAGNQCPWYPTSPERGGVQKPGDTWWMQTIEAFDGELLVNDAWGGATISSTGYDGADYTERSFVTRATRLGEDPDLILICGGTNDDWAKSPLGKKDQYKDWTEEDLKSFGPSMTKMYSILNEKYPKAKKLFVINGLLSKKIKGMMKQISQHYKVPTVEVNDFPVFQNHPTAEGMKIISKRVINAVRGLGFKEIKKKPAKPAPKDLRGQAPVTLRKKCRVLEVLAV